ncbi:MAG: RluA family pseudouridine synthase [Phycisphaeraceae bacterium]|nr:RluA family pseudouridine synthase [Phycisphaerales bacterium]MCB9860716.1 RluA family pseudouridine synthase [Phycisphaeraceae bacterium]
MHLSIEPNEHITFGIRYQDENVVVIEKPTRRVTDPGLGHDRDTILNGLFHHFPHQLQQLGKTRDFGLLHRLDRETSGLLVVALSKDAYDGLRAQFEDRKIAKYYWAVCRGVPNTPTGIINRPILEQGGQQRGSKLTAVISSQGQPAATAFRVLTSASDVSMIEARPITGRLHQIRVHMSSIKCPILGDTFYAPKPVAATAPRVALHAHRLVFTHPVTQEPMDVRSRFPRDLVKLLNRLGLQRPDLDGSAASSAQQDTAADDPC